jgi:HK97 family phage prohead protease
MADKTMIEEDIESRPYPSEHSCRLFAPIKGAPTRRVNGEREHEGKKYDVIYQKKDGKWKDQAYRYKKDTWTASQARSHCKSHDGSFEAAQSSIDNEEDKVKEQLQLEREVRSFPVAEAEMRVEDEDKPRLVGYAAKYGITTDLGYFIEKIRAGAFDEVLKTSDARALKNHDPNLLLGRESSETLRLSSNSVGLKFEIDVPNTSTGRDTIEEVRRGDLSGCSFAFRVEEDEWKHFDDRPSERTIVKIGQLYDVGPVTYPAYQDTTVAVRSLEASKSETDKEVLQKAQQEAQEGEPEETKADKKHEAISPERQKEIERGYRRAGRIYNRCIEEIERIKSAQD